MLIKKTVELLSSLKLTVVLLAFAIVLVFVGTIAQADEGLYQAQAHYFKQWFVVGAHLFGIKIPIIMPGGYLIGTVLLVNLVCAHIYRFEFSMNKAGIQLAHAGIILLLVGQLMTDMLAHELQMSFSEGETRDTSQSSTEYELAFMQGKTVTSIPVSQLQPGAELSFASLPFSIKVKEFWKNSDMEFRAPMTKNAPTVVSNGIALDFDFRSAPEVKAMDQKNVPTAIIELVGPHGSYGDWVASDWAGDPSVISSVQQGYARQVGAAMTRNIIAKLTRPQTLEINTNKFTFLIRPMQVKHDFSLTLLKATHTTYPGTDIPKDFRSRVRIENKTANEQREMEISMNQPLRYGGYAFYQYQMNAGDLVERAGQTPSSVLQVVRNPSWLTPYVGCTIVGLGLLVQFMMHLTKFISRKK